MNVKKWWLVGMLIFILLIILSAWIYYFPYQKHLARTEIDQYLKAQGVKMSGSSVTEDRKTVAIRGLYDNDKI